MKIITISHVTEHNHKFFVTCNTGFMDLIPILQHFVITEYEQNMKTKATYKKEYTLCERHKNGAIFYKGFFELVVSIAYLYGFDVEYSPSLESFLRPKLLINDKWKTILSNEERKVDGKTQYQYLDAALDTSGLGFMKFVTGYGKTELQLSLLSSYSDLSNKNIAVLAPTSVILEGIIERMGKWSETAISRSTNERVTPGKEFNPDLNINVINPTGFLRKKIFQDQSTQDWLRNVGLILADEAHHMSAKSWMDFVNYCPNVEYLYGFSGTPDIKSHIAPTLKSCLTDHKFPNTWSSQVGKTLSITGLIKTDVSGADLDVKKISIEILKGNYSLIPDEEKANYNKALDYTFSSPRLASVMVKYLNMHSDRTFFFIVHKKETGRILRNNILSMSNFSEEEICFLESGQVEPTYLKDIDGLKEHMSSGKVRLLISTSVSMEGFDTNSISGCFLSAGKNVRYALQVMGRSRASDSICTLIHDTGNPLLIKQTKSKLKIIKSEFGNNVVSQSYINL